MEWQPIETAPKDGTEVIACFSNNYGFQENPTTYGPWTCAFRNGKWMASWGDRAVIYSESWAGTEYQEAEIDPTHWMPLPSPPKT